MVGTSGAHVHAHEHEEHKQPGGLLLRRHEGMAKAQANAPLPLLPQLRKPPRVPRSMTCAACKRAKVPCGGAYPCARCFKQSLQCVMQARYHKSRPKGDPEVAAREAAERACSVLIELAFERYDPTRAAETMAQAFIQLAAEGVIVRPAVVMGLQFWKHRSIVCGVDVTCGGAAHIAKHANPPITALELEGPGFALDMPDEAIRPVLVADVERLRDAIDAFQASDTFVHLDDDPENKAIYCSVFDSQGRLQECGNRLFEETFLSSHDFLEESLATRTINTILFSALLAPEDRTLWYRAAFTICFTPAQRVVEFVKLADRDGSVKLYIMEVSKAALPGSNAIIGGIVTRLQAAPASRHISARPSLHHRIQVFRSHSATTGASSAAAHAAAAPVARLPAMATLPFDDDDDEAVVIAAPISAEELFGAPNMSKAAAPPLFPAVTGSGYGHPEGDRPCSASLSSSSGSGSGSPLTPAPAKPAAAGAALAAMESDGEWAQALPLPGQEEEEADQPQPKEKGGILPLPFAVRSAEEAELWQDVLEYYRGEAGEASPVAPGAVAAAEEEEAEPGFGWGR